MKYSVAKIIFSAGIAHLSIGCGGGGGSDSFDQFQAASTQAGSFSGLASLEKNPDLSWNLRWKLLESDDFQYAVFRDDTEKKFDYNSPLVMLKYNNYRYKPKNIFTDGVVCFVVRVANYAADENTASQCTTDEPLVFSGANAIERLGDGGYLVSWSRIPVDGVIYTIYERNGDEPFNFQQPSYDAITENFYNIPVFGRGEQYCYSVRYSHPDLPADENTLEQCPVKEVPLDFSGIKTVTALSPTKVKIEWIVAGSKEVSGYRIYQGSDFKEGVGAVEAGVTSFEIESLVPGRQYNFGIRAIDEFSREDTNLIIRPIKMPTE